LILKNRVSQKQDLGRTFGAVFSFLQFWEMRIKKGMGEGVVLQLPRRGTD